jgi:ligand-binding sensor domain-containing protein/serine phosphatase RsbU (regulator of sigma subunit)
MKRIVLIFLLSACLHPFVCGQTQPAIQKDKASGSPIQQYSLDIWNTDNGLVTSTLTKIIQSRDGYLWITSFAGLIRFNGAEFKVFDRENVPNLVNESFLTLIEDRQGALWLGSNGGGLTKFVNNTVALSLTNENGLSGNIVEAILEDSQGHIWVATRYHGVNLLKDGKIQPLYAPEALQKATVISLAQDKEGAIWIGTIGKGLFRYKNNTFTQFTVAHGLPENSVTAIYPETDGSMLIGTRDSGLCRYAKDIFSPISRNFSNSKKRLSGIVNIYKDSHDVYWLTSLEGLIRYQDNHLELYTEAHGLPNNSVYDILEDKEGSLWITTWRGGLNRLKQSKFTNLSMANGLIYNIVNTIAEDTARKGYWIGTDEGLSFFKDGTYTTYTTKQGLIGNRVRDVLVDRSNTTWICTYDGLSQLKNGKITNYTDADGLSDYMVRVAFQDSRGMHWFGTRNGLNRFNKGSFTTYKKEQGLSNTFIMSINEDAAGHLWVGTNGGGITLLADTVLRTYTMEDGLASNFIFCTYKDAAGRMWVGTDNGLSVYEDGSFHTYTLKDGLPADDIFNVVEDGEDNLWFTSNRGVFRIARQELLNHRAGQIATFSSTRYGKNDGLKSLQVTPIARCMLDSKGRVWLPMLNGVSIADPQLPPTNTIAPNVVMEMFATDGKPTDLNISPQLEPGVLRFDFHYAALSFLNADKVLYKYKLSPIDKNWVEAGTDRVARYTNLPPGRYTFTVMACNNDGVWNETGASHSFELKPFFYQTTWFKGLVLLFAFALGAGIYFLRVQRLKKTKQRLETVVKLRTHEITRQKDEIKLQNEQIQLQHDQLMVLNEEVNKRNENFLSSVTYASRIQSAMLPLEEKLSLSLSEHLLLFRPRDVVSGDFYWFHEENGKIIVAVADCTGHGVPGAFMSMIGDSLLNQIVIDKDIMRPDLILNELHTGIRKVLKQDESENRDGMDIAICVIDRHNRTLEYAGARNPLYLFQAGEFRHIKADINSIGGQQYDPTRLFTAHMISIEEPTTFYLFSDGYQDQFGGPAGRKFMVKRFKALLKDIHHLPMPEQKEILEQELFSWMGTGFEQVDDILVMGVRV